MQYEWIKLESGACVSMCLRCMCVKLFCFRSWLPAVDASPQEEVPGRQKA